MADDEIIVKLTAQTDQLKSGMAEAASTVQANTDAMAASARGYSDATLDLIYAQNVAMSHAREYMEVQRKVAPAIKEVEVASNGLASALTRNSRTAYSASALISDAMTGQFSRSRREIAALANETGVMSQALQFALSPMGLFIAGLAALGVGVVEVQDHYDKFEQTILRTGNIIGMSAGELQGMANDIGLVTGHTFEAVDAVQALGASGRFTGDQLRIAAEAAVDFSTVTGEKIGAAAKIIESMQERPAKAIAELNDQFHFLTQSQADLIEKLLDTGQNAQAAAVAVKAFHDAMADRANEMADHASALARDWDSVSNNLQQAAEHLAEYIEVSQGGGDTAEKLAVAQRQLSHDEEVAAHSILYRWGLLHDEAQKYIEKEKEAVAELQNQQRAEDAAAQAKAKSAQATADQFDKATHSKRGGSGRDDEQAFQQAQYAAQQQGHELSLTEQKAWWQKRLDADKAGGAADANATAAAMRHVVELQKQIEREGEADARKGAAAAKRQHEQDAQSAIRALDEKRDATVKFSAERMALDQQIVAAAIKWYGQDSNAYREAEKQKEEDSQALRQHNIQIARQTLEAQHQADLAGLDDKKQQAINEQELGKISSAQLLAIEKKLLQDKLQLDIQYLRQKVELEKAAGGTANEQQLDAQILTLKRQTNAKLLSLDNQFIKQSESFWKQYSKQIEGTFQGAVNGMLFQGQTLQQGMQQVFIGIAEDGIKWITQWAETWIAQNVLAHTQATATATAANATQAAQATGLAGVNALASFAAAPWPVDIGAPAFAAAIMADAAGMASLASAAGGWERVPADGMMAQLHKDEMVLPARIAEPMRKTFGSGGGGGTTHVHIHTESARSFRDFLKRNPGAISSALGHGRRNGWS